jgi:AcrR family transcriptional regulator
MGKKRDPESKKEEIFKAVASVLRKKGYAGLDISTIAAEAGTSRKVIYYYFKTLHNLLKQFITREDYWTLFFETYQLGELPAEKEVRDTFITMMQSNLKYFTDEGDMQEIILWQMSKLDPLTRRISESREEQGAPLLALTDPYFTNSNYNFRALIAIILSSTYYLVLHSNKNKSTVAGIDLNLADDWWTIHKTYGQLIELMWQAAAREERGEREETETEHEPNMNYAFEKLRNLAAEVALLRPADDTGTTAHTALKAECHNLEMVMMRHLLKLKSKTRIKTYLYINLHTLVSVCDSLYDPLRKHNPNAQAVLDLLDTVRQQLNGYIPGNLIIPRMFRDRENRVFQEQMGVLRTKILALKLDEVLMKLLLAPYQRFGDPKLRMEWGDFKYLRKFNKRLLDCVEEDYVTADGILETLLGLGFNDTAFIHYYFQLMRSKAAAADGVAGRQELLIKYRSAIKQVVQLTKMRFDNYKRPVIEELTKWLDAELEVLSKKKGSRVLV